MSTRGRPATRLAARRALPLLAALAVGCAGDAPPGARELESPARGYESPPVVDAEALLPEGALASAVHEVDAQVPTDGVHGLFGITSEFGRFEARGAPLLRIRVAEIGALYAMSRVSKTEQFAVAVTRAARHPFVVTWNLLTKPVDTVTGIPLGAWRTLERGAGLGGERGELEDSAARELIGFEPKKRELAAAFGVDPYSSNPRLQRELNRMAWASYAGGIPFEIAPVLQAKPLSRALDQSMAPKRGRELLRTLPPPALRIHNRRRLERLGIPAATVDAFLRHPWYSPRHETLIADALEALDAAEGRGAFLEAALASDSEVASLGYQRLSELLVAYQEGVVTVQRVLALDAGLVAAYTPERALVVPLEADYLAWTPAAYDLARIALRPSPGGVDVKVRELWITGTLSPRAASELARLGLRVRDRAFERLAAGAR